MLGVALLTAGCWRAAPIDGPGGVCTGATTDNVGPAASVVSFGGNEHAFHYGATAHRLRHAVYNGSTWTCENLDATTQRLRHAWSNGGAWGFEDLDGPGVAGGVGRTAHAIGPSITVAANSPAPFIDVLYGDAVTHSLRHAQWMGGSWRFEVIDGAGNLTGGGTTDQVGVPPTVVPTAQINAAVYGAANSSILHVFTGDQTTGALREECTLGTGILAPANCAN